MKNLKLSDWASIAEIIGAIAVVVSLLYLAAQINGQTQEARAAAMHEFMVGWRESTAAFTDRELSETFVKASSNFESLTKSDRLILFGGLHGLIRLFEEAFLQYKQKRLDPGLWDAINRQYSSLLSDPVYKRYWEMRGDWYHQEFRQYVDDMGRTAYQL